MRVRPMTPADIGVVSALTGQLGYPVRPEETAGRFATIAARADHAVLVAERAGAVVGWVHVRAAHDLEQAAHAVIEGLVVDAAVRGQGAGGALLQRAEAWAAERGLAFIRLHSRVDRQGAHAFYERRGYARVATSHQYRKG